VNHIYILSGLGADERAFQNLDLNGLEHTFLPWIPPERNETIGEYAWRIAQGIKTKDPVIMGLSFGGMVAVELAKHLTVHRLILISSAKTRKEIPFFYRLAGKLFLHKIIPISWMKSSNFFSNWLFGTSTNPDKNLLKRILEDTDPEFIKWSLNAVINWKNTDIPPNTLHIHGTRDRILPMRNIKCNVAIENGGHFMLVNRSEEISKIIRSKL
jgi:pimeloyl-ACP methyl ester carboxylesterase